MILLPDLGSGPTQTAADLAADIDKGLADLTAGRVADFDARRIIARGRKVSAACAVAVEGFFER